MSASSAAASPIQPAVQCQRVSPLSAAQQRHRQHYIQIRERNRAEQWPRLNVHHAVPFPVNEAAACQIACYK